MSDIDPDIVALALRDSLDRLSRSACKDGAPIHPTQNLLDVVDSFGFAELILDLEASLEIELPLDQVDLASIARIDRLIGFICKHG